MIRKVITFTFGAMLVLALALYVNYGVRGSLEFGSGFRAIVSGSVNLFNKVRFGIPAIPSIPVEENSTDFFSQVINFVNFLSQMVNAFTSLVNAFIEVLTFVWCILVTVQDIGTFNFDIIVTTPVISVPLSSVPQVSFI